jgi:hypothetical protein
MGLVGKICMFPLVRELKKLKSRLFNDPELAAGQIYEFVLATQPPKVIEYVQRLFYNHQSVSEKHPSLIEEKLADSYSKPISPFDASGIDDGG